MGIEEINPPSIGGKRICYCVDCFTEIGASSSRQRKRCDSCSLQRERARWKAKEEKNKLARRKRGLICQRYETDEERAAAKARQRKIDREKEKEKRRKIAEPARLARIAAKTEREKERQAKLEKRKQEKIDKAKILANYPWNDKRLSIAERFSIRYKLDPEFAIKHRIKNALRRAAKSNPGKVSATLNRFGYSADELKKHLERQFTKGMSWGEFLKGKIHIDHITPLKLFNLQSEEELVSAWHIANLRPMWASANKSKGKKRLFLI
jgi:hypothetical protein